MVIFSQICIFFFFIIDVVGRVFENAAIEKCFSTGGPRSSFCGPQEFSHFVKNHTFRQKISLKIIKSQPYHLQKLQETTKKVYFSSIKCLE